MNLYLSHRLGVLWGVLHLKASHETYAFAAGLGENAAAPRVEQVALTLALAGLVGIVVALWKNWKNDPTGYWVNLVLISVIDLGRRITMRYRSHAGTIT